MVHKKMIYYKFKQKPDTPAPPSVTIICCNYDWNRSVCEMIELQGIVDTSDESNNHGCKTLRCGLKGWGTNTATPMKKQLLVDVHFVPCHHLPLAPWHRHGPGFNQNVSLTSIVQLRTNQCYIFSPHTQFGKLMFCAF